MSAKIAGTIHISPLAHLAAQMRAMGYPVASIIMRDPAQQTKPDEIRFEMTAGLFGPPRRVERGFYAPIMDWVLEDGKRFTAKLKLRLSTRTVDTLFSRTERTIEDYPAMQADLIELIKQSCDPNTTVYDPHANLPLKDEAKGDSDA